MSTIFNSTSNSFKLSVREVVSGCRWLVRVALFAIDCYVAGFERPLRVLLSFCRFTCLTALLAGFAIPRAADAEGWATLPDGRVIVGLKDIRVALPASGPDTELIRFADRHNIHNEMTLKQVIDRPTEARRLFDSADLIYVSLPNLQDRTGPYLNRFPRSDFRSGQASFVVGNGALASCKPWTDNLARLAARIKQQDAQVSADGWAEFKLGKSPVTLAYVRPGYDRTKMYFPGVTCGYFKDCAFSKCLTADLAVSYGFSRAAVEQSGWVALDQKVRDLFKYLFIDL
jgi:hypothetical protein